jgi:hypothetical protein
MNTRRGVVLIVVLVAIALLSLAAYTFTELMLAEHEAADLHGRALRAQALADSGVTWVEHVLSEEETVRRNAGGLYDNLSRFRGQLVLPNEADDGPGGFAVLAPNVNDSGDYDGSRFGLEDESTRLNLNILLVAEESQENGGRELLMALPAMTEDVADAILDWIDEDDEVRELGCEIEHYSGLDPPYAPKNGPLETVEDLLLVRGVTPELLFGRDTNRNGTIDPDEAANSAIAVIEDERGDMSRGWSAYLTLHSQEKNVRPDGDEWIDLNADDLKQLHADLSEAFSETWATFVVAYRQNGPYTGSQGNSQGGEGEDESDDAGGPATGKLDFEQEGRFPLTSVLDVVGVRVRVQFDDEEEASILQSPFPALGEGLAQFLDKAAVNTEDTIPGRININQAPRAVLLGIPGMSEEIVNEILSQRELELTDDESPRRHETWLMTEGLVSLDEMRQLLPFVCVGGDVYRAQIVGFLDNGGPTTRVEAVFDATGEQPRLLFWRDVSHLGRGWPLETLGAGGGGDLEPGMADAG